jgi:hypothetical protein
MQIAEFTVGELPDFVNSSLWQQLEPKPITRLRAISQFHNPRAKKDDIALIIAYENNQLLGVVGLLPNLINGQAHLVANSNTCWWADPVKGKQIAVPLFLKAFARCNQRMFMTNCTPHTLSILQKTSWFNFPQTAPGRRGFLRFNLHEVVPIKFPKTIRLKTALKIVDSTVNFLLTPVRFVNLLRFTRNVPHVEYSNSPDSSMTEYIEQNSENEFIRRTGPELEWILNFPWLIEKNTNQEPVEYPFSHIVKQFEQYFVKISVSGKTIGLLLISIRDGHMKIPYAYLHEEDACQVLKVVYQQAVIKKAVTLTVFHPKLSTIIDSVPHPFIFRKKIKRLMAISKQITHLYETYPVLQDGDGDVVFT